MSRDPRRTRSHTRSARRIWLVGLTIVGAVAGSKSAQVRLNPQRVEIVPGDRLGPGARRIIAAVQADLREAERGKIVERAVAIAEVDVIRIGLRARFVGQARARFGKP
jgi:hypothetical protein